MITSTPLEKKIASLRRMAEDTSSPREAEIARAKLNKLLEENREFIQTAPPKPGEKLPPPSGIIRAGVQSHKPSMSWPPK